MCVCVCVCVCVCMSHFVYSRNWHNIVNQLYFNKINKYKQIALENNIKSRKSPSICGNLEHDKGGK